MMTEKRKLTGESKFSEAIGLKTTKSLLAVAVLLTIGYLFISGEMYRFYASILFSFYALTEKMWVSVIMLGAFQTLIMVPFRIIRLMQGNHIREFVEKAEESSPQTLSPQKKFKEDFTFGNSTFLFYLVDFMVQLTTFLTIGRLFLTDFYTKFLREGVLYGMVPYPDYPIREVFFKIPYLTVIRTMDLGWGVVVGFWVAAMVVFWGVWLVKYISKRMKDESTQATRIMASRYYYGYVFLLLVGSYVLLRHLPVEVAVKIFSGDVSRPNQGLNTITAVTTALMLVWFGYRKILRKSDLARRAGVSEQVIQTTARGMFRTSVTDGVLVGLGAYFVTNHIPSAFELSIFTFEIIAILSPLTLDKVILAGSRKVKEAKKPEKAEEGSESRELS